MTTFSEFSRERVHPANLHNKPQSFIDSWVRRNGVLYGHVLCHDHQTEFKTTVQQTSQLKQINVDEGWAETQNTFYVLGEPADMNTLLAKLVLFEVVKP